jgi:hypothetical protein
MLDLSAIIVSWNTRAMTVDGVRSILEDSRSLQREVIVVDNASTDGSPEAIAREFPEVRLIRNEENIGFARANNQGLAIARGRYVALINSDVVVLPRCIEAMVRFMDEHPDVGLAGPRILNPDRTVQYNCFRLPNYWNVVCETFALPGIMPKRSWAQGTRMSDWKHDSVRDVEMLIGCFWMARAEALRVVGPLDEAFFMYGEDMDWCRRYRQAAWRIVLNPDAEAVHFGGGSSSAHPARFFVELQKSILQYWRKHHGLLGWFYCLFFTVLHQVLRIIPGLFIYLLRPSRRRETSMKIKRSLACLGWFLGRARIS